MKKQKISLPSPGNVTPSSHRFRAPGLARILVVLQVWQLVIPGSLAYAQDLAVAPDRIVVLAPPGAGSPAIKPNKALGEDGKPDDANQAHDSV